MGLFLVYILKSALCLAAFYLFYRLLLSRETFHRFNRLALLGVLVLSCMLPLAEVSMKHPSEAGQTMLSLEQWLLMMAAAPVAETVPDAAHVEVPWVQGLLLVYVAGAVFFVLRGGYSLLRLLALLRSAKREDAAGHVSGCKGVCLLVHDRPIAPFSWMRCVVISRKDLEEDGRAILTHELAHIRRGHSWDLLLADLCIFLQWFNPAAWLLKQELQSVHEYEADEAVLASGVNAKEYQLLLIKKAVGTRRYSLANSFNHSKLKKRITMMTKRKSSPWARAKYLYVLPLAAIAVVAFARPEVSGVTNEIAAAKVSDLSAIVKGNVPESVVSQPDTLVTSRLKDKVADAVAHEGVDQSPEFPGGSEALRKYVKDNIRHPLVDTRSGNVIIQFTVDEEGRVVNPKLLRGLDEEFDAEAIRLVEAMPRWKPGMKDSKPVPVQFTLPIFFPSVLAEQLSTPEVKEPVVVVDGKVMEWDAFKAQVSPDKIESITILKGDKAAAYGTRGVENGVIMVKTKQIHMLSLRTEGDVPQELVDSVKDFLRGQVSKVNVETLSLQSATGLVKGEDGEPMPGVIVLEAGTKHGTVTGKDGRFELRLSSPDAMLSLQYVGFKTLNVKSGTDLELVMKAE